MTRRVIFLDIDGVLAPIRRWDRYGDIEPACMDVLNEIVAVSGADVVVSSTHRHGKTVAELHELLRAEGLTGRVVDKTPTGSPGAERGVEIAAWLDAYPMAVDRFNVRRELMVDEANSVGTTDLRARMLPPAFSEPIRTILREYVDVRLEYGRSGYDDAKFQRTVLRTKELQDQLWRHSVALAREARDPITSIFLQSLNETIDLSEKRLAALENRVPVPVSIMLVVIATLACTVVGATVRRRYWLAMLISPVMIAVAMGFIADLDSPRTGLIRVSQSSMDRLQQDLRGTPTPR
jgi:hypothetical protein